MARHDKADKAAIFLYRKSLRLAYNLLNQSGSSEPNINRICIGLNWNPSFNIPSYSLKGTWCKEAVASPADLLAV